MDIPRTMSTQHPDNASMPFFASNSLLEGEDEIQEAFYAFSHLGCLEQMWDCEGKEVDGFVVKKLLTKYEGFFREKKIGKDLRLTLRVPNPAIEKTEAKILLETLESIPRSFDTAQIFYGQGIAPIFEVILPMTSSADDLNKIYYYYRDFVAGKQEKKFYKNSLISDWIGKFMPKEINVIPLIETKEQLLEADKIVEEYIKGKKIEEQRVFLARSDPALNYGSLSAVLLDKLALYRISLLEEKTSTELLPIIGVGSAPFRGNLKPTNVITLLEGYPSVQTFTLQSAFKYDFDEKQVREAVEEINQGKRKKPVVIEEKKCVEIIERTSKEYIKQIRLLAPLVNRISAFVPKRRKRKLHIGLFGYSRHMKGITLPRAITFCCALYSIGFPPELLGLNAMKQKDTDYIGSVYKNFEKDLSSSLQYFNSESLKIIPKEVARKIKPRIVDFEENTEHKKLTTHIINDLKKGNTNQLSENITRAAWVRKFLG